LAVDGRDAGVFKRGIRRVVNGRVAANIRQLELRQLLPGAALSQTETHFSPSFVVSIIGVPLGVTVLILVISVMTGFDRSCGKR